MTRNYQQVLDYLYQTLPMFQRVGAAAYKNDLTNTIALCEALGNPHQKFKSIHVAGTNGKGSSSHMLAAIFQSAGYKTGLYTSPHLKEFTERIKINGADVDRDFVVDFVNRLHTVIEQIQPSFFEMTVAMAFEYFTVKKVDMAVIEVGLGGRLDSTNVVTPELSLITNISFDHKDLLGDTLEKIAFEKAGIIKEGVPIVVSERQASVEKVFMTKAGESKSELSFASDLIQLKQASNGFDVHCDGQLWFKELNTGLKGHYQRRNLPGVLAVVLQLRKIGYDISDAAIRLGISNVVSLTGLKGRWQTLGDKPLIICDTGHNPDGIKEVVDQIKITPHHHLYFVLGLVKEKDPKEILQVLPTDATYYFCQAKIPRALDATLLAKEANEFGLKGRVMKDVNEAIEAATRSAGKDDLIFIGGSTFVVAEINGL